MSVEPQELSRIARLARLRLSEDECGRLTAELNAILEHVETLLAIDVDVHAAAPLSSPAVEARRPDEPAGDPLAHPLDELAPEFRSGFFTVPRVLGP